MNNNNDMDNALFALINEVDAKGGSRAIKSKQYSIDRLREEGYSDERIEALLGITLRD